MKGFHEVFTAVPHYSYLSIRFEPCVSLRLFTLWLDGLAIILISCREMVQNAGTTLISWVLFEYGRVTALFSMVFTAGWQLIVI